MSRRLPVVLTSLVLAALVGGPAATAGNASAAAARPVTLTTAQFEAQLVSLTNTRRQKIGCARFTTNSALVKAARKHSLLMVQTGTFSHQVLHEAGLATRIVRAGYYKHWRALAENIAWGEGSTPASVFDLWLHSAPHRANLQNCALRDIGYGVRYDGAKVWITGDYGRH